LIVGTSSSVGPIGDAATTLDQESALSLVGSERDGAVVRIRGFVGATQTGE
jgi:hypothetical protein